MKKLREDDVFSCEEKIGFLCDTTFFLYASLLYLAFALDGLGDFPFLIFEPFCEPFGEPFGEFCDDRREDEEQ